jgi:predicted permease
VGISLLTGVVFGLAPAWQATRTQVNAGLKDTAVSTTRQRKGMAGRGLVMLQIALSMLLVVGAGLFASTLRNLHAEKLGFDPHNLLMFSIQAPVARYAAPKDVELHQRIEERLAAVPGVQAVTLTAQPVLAHSRSSFMVRTDEEARRPGTALHQIPMNSVGDSFFSTYHIPILVGRGFETSDTASSPLVAVISRGMAQKLYPNSDPLGRSFETGFLGDHPRIKVYRIIGVAEDAKYDRLQQKPPMVFYNLYRQLESSQEMTYELKTILPPAAILPSIRAAVAEIDKDLPLTDVRTQEQQIAATISQQKTFAVLTGAFGVLALVLACIGIYGLMAYNVARRTNEIGIRMALGARAGQMLRMVLREASWMAVVGIAVGLGAALLLARYVKSMLYGLTATDPWILAGAGVLLLAVALLAGWGPARRASRVEPMEALRHE